MAALVWSVVRGLKMAGLLGSAAVGFWVRRPKDEVEGATRIHRLCRDIVEALRLECDVSGVLPEGGAVVCNHLSYMDVLLLGAQRPFVMVAKTEVRGWPLFGWLTAQAGTVYVKRGGGATTYRRVNAAMARAYATGLPVLFFPEGTTTDGDYPDGGVMPFRRGLFHSVLDNDVPLRVAGLRYSLMERNDGASVGNDVCWWGDADFVPHLFRFLGLRGVRAEVRFGDEVEERGDRFVLSETARARVMELYGASGGWNVAAEEAGCERELAEAL
jgi:1-acyl-sn-glycerol-3-phosphate acyltransferase